MATETSSDFKSAAQPTPLSHETSGGDAPPVTPSQQVASHQYGLGQGPTFHGAIGQAVQNQTHVSNMQRDGNRSDQANHYTRTQSPTVADRITALGEAFLQAKQRHQQEKSKQQTKGNEQDKDREHER